MSLSPDCPVVEERLSDYHEGALDSGTRVHVEAHLAGCPACNALSEALAQVIDAFRVAQAAADVEPAADLAERAAVAALRAAWSARAGAAMSSAWQASPRALALVRGVAAALALATTGALYLGPSALGSPGRIVDRTTRAGAYLAERKDHLVEDLRLLRVVIATAFEGRLDRVNDRVEDYRRLIERRRGAAPSVPLPNSERRRPASFANFGDVPAVQAVIPGATARRARSM